jgi:phenylpropionate dioxygenase-like ring-hydroxylating dioxygenase large terminal subunit
MEGWIAVSRTAALKPHETRKVTLNARAYVVWRDHKSRVQMAPDACRHRGASLSTGRVVQDGLRQGCLECPYHGWKYSGKKLYRPWNEGAELIQAEFDVREQDHLLWVRPKGLDGPDPPEVPYINNPAFHTSWFETTMGQCAQLIIENGIDPSHASWVHANGFGFGTASEEPTAVVCKDTVIDFDYIPNKSSLSSQLFGITTTHNMHTYALPYTTWSTVAIRDKLLMTFVTLCPIGPQETRMFVGFSQNFGVPSDLFVMMGKEIVEQDRRILEHQVL